MKLNTRQEMLNEVDSLEGNINRMCVTDSPLELKRMKEFALRRINDIYDFNFQRVNEDISDSVCPDCHSEMQLMGYHEEDTENEYPWYWCETCFPEGPY